MSLKKGKSICAALSVSPVSALHLAGGNPHSDGLTTAFCCRSSRSPPNASSSLTEHLGNRSPAGW